LLLLHVPVPELLDRVVVAPIHTVATPVLEPGAALTVAIATAAHPAALE
jgi:hypothetical protein